MGGLVVSAWAGGCQPSPPAPAAGATSARPAAGPAAEAARLINEGQPDAALQRLEQAPADADSLFQQGRAWAKKAEGAPLPTAVPASSPLPPGAPAPVAPEFKPEERRAIELFEKALAETPTHGGAHFALAALLAPHAIRRHELERPPVATPPPSGRRRPRPTPPPPPLPDTGGVDVSPGRIVREFQLAAQADTSPVVVESLIAFGTRVGRLDAAEAGYEELLRRVKESAVPLVRYGDFLLTEKKEPDRAIEQYRQALIWKPDDDATRRKIVDIYMARGVELFGQQQYASADVQFKQAERFVTDRTSEQAQKLQGYEARLREIRGR